MLTFFNGCILVKTSLINIKPGVIVNLGVLFLTLWITSCLSEIYRLVPSPFRFEMRQRFCISKANRPRSIYQYSSMAPRLSGQNCKFFKLLLSLNSQKRLGYKENNTKYRILTRKPRSHVRKLIYRTWPIAPVLIKRKEGALFLKE